MIKIDTKNIAPKNIDAIVKEHYERVAEKSGKKGTAKTLVDIINTKISHSKSPLKKRFYKRLKKDIELDYDNSLITAKPPVLNSIKNKYWKTYKALLIQPSFRKELLKVFFYENYDKWNAYQLAIDLNIKVCPYCNRQYTFTIGTSLKKGTRPQFDHFFDKGKNPFLALSFYNLVPSCGICNQDFKGFKEFDLTTHLHPYMEGFDERVKFSIKPQNINFLRGIPTSFEVKYRVNKKKKVTINELKKILNNSKIFKLLPLYNQHKDYISEIIQKSIAYNEDYYKDLFHRYNGTLFNSINDVKKMVLSNYISEDELGQRVLAKLTKDIAEELQILE